MSLSVSFSLLHSATAAVANDLRPAAVVAARLAMRAARGCTGEPLRQSLLQQSVDVDTAISLSGVPAPVDGSLQQRQSCPTASLTDFGSDAS